MSEAVLDYHSKRVSTQNVAFTVAVLGIVNLVNQMDRVLFSLMVEPIKAELQLSDAQMGLLGGLAFAVCFALTGLVAGRIADRWNRIHLIGIALTVWSVFTAACGFASNFVQMFVSRMMVGIGEAGCVPSAQSLISDIAPHHRRAFLLSIFTGIGMIGTLIGLVVGGIVMDIVGWRMTFVVFGVAGLLPLLVLLIALRDPRTASDTAVLSDTPWTTDVLAMMKRREVHILLLAIPLLFTIAGAATWIPAFFQRTYGITTEEFSRTGGAFLGLGLIFGTFAGGFIAKKLVARDPRWEFWWSGLSCSLAVVPLVLVCLTTDINLAHGALFLAFFIAGTGFGPSMATILTAAGKTVRATAVAMSMFVTSLVAYGGVPAVIGLLSDVFAANGVSAEDGTTLKYALLMSMVLPPIASMLFFAASRIAYSANRPA